jgi:hypothetical protein
MRGAVARAQAGVLVRWSRHPDRARAHRSKPVGAEKLRCIVSEYVPKLP